MRRIFVFATVAALALAMGMGGAVAAENNTTAEPEAEAGDGWSEPIDGDTRITDWSYSSGQFLLEIEADTDTRISLTEAGSFEEGTTQFNYDERTLEEGTNMVRFSVTDRQGAAVAIATDQSLQEGGGAIVSTGMIERNPLANFGGESGLLTGIAMTVALAGIGAGYVVRSEESGVRKA